MDFDLRSGLPVTTAPGLGGLKSWTHLKSCLEHLHLAFVYPGLPHSMEPRVACHLDGSSGHLEGAEPGEGV